MFAGVSAMATMDVNPTARLMAAVDIKRLKIFITIHLFC
jgi:hypothetical protein